MRRHVSEREIFNKNGFLERKNLFNEKEVALLLAAAKSPDVTDHAFEMKDRLGKRSRLTLWFTPGDDTLGFMSRSDRIVGYVQYLLGDGEVCHFHSKVMQKEPRVGGGLGVASGLWILVSEWFPLSRCHAICHDCSNGRE